jgi:hypothetical protein
MLCDIIAKTLNTPYVFVRDYSNIVDNRRIFKTHASYTGEPNYEYKAVYMWAGVGDVLCSLYLNRTSYGGDPYLGLRYHLMHLGMAQRDINRFFALDNTSRDDAFEYLIYGDRIGLQENVKSWYRSPHTIKYHYNDLCKRPKLALEYIGQHLGIEGLSEHTPTITPRLGRFGKLPTHLRDLILDTYPSWMF